MKFRFLSLVFLLGMPAVYAAAQHAGDIQFGYDNLSAPNTILVENNSVTADGIMYFDRRIRTARSVLSQRPKCG